jgi:hypothetical protein
VSLGMIFKQYNMITMIVVLTKNVWERFKIKLSRMIDRLKDFYDNIPLMLR